jgi:radical SAM protein with 4Fe4S-binding SPASM domain
MERGLMKNEIFQSVCAEIKKNIDKVKVVVLYHGGEPLLNKMFPQMIEQLKAAGVPFVKTVSNGMLLNEKAALEILESGIDLIEFSLDGESPGENDFVRRRADYQTVIANIKRFLDIKIERKLVTPAVYITSTKFLLAEELQNKNRETEPAPPQYLLQEFSGKYAAEIAGFKCFHAMRWPHMGAIDEFYEVQFDPFDEGDLNECDHVENTVTVRWDGNVVACCFDLTSQYILGNVLKSPLSSIWNNERYLSLRESIDLKKFIDICSNCNVVRPNAFLIMKPEVRSKLMSRKSRPNGSVPS